jgi:DNA-directed RNA polymerase subunit alpha
MLDFGYDESRDAALEPTPIPEASVRVMEATDTHAVFSVEPLQRGYGLTVGNPLRRVLLSSIEGSAINWVRIEGIDHEYSTLPNVKEDVVDILLNIKAINLRSLSSRPGKLRLEVEGPGEICAGDIMASSDFEIANPEQHIATLDGTNSRLVIEMNVEQGKAYEPASAANGLPIGVLPVDAIYTPVRKVNYSVERTRVGQYTNFDRLVIEVWTNGAIAPVDAVKQAGQGLMDSFFKFTGLSADETQEGERSGWIAGIPAPVYNMPVESLNLTARTLNCLKRASIHRVGEILEKSRGDLLRIRNFGERSLEELAERLGEINIFPPQFGTVPPSAESSDGEETAVEADGEDAEAVTVGSATEEEEE